MLVILLQNVLISDEWVLAREGNEDAEAKNLFHPCAISVEALTAGPRQRFDQGNRRAFVAKQIMLGRFLFRKARLIEPPRIESP